MFKRPTRTLAPSTVFRFIPSRFDGRFLPLTGRLLSVVLSIFTLLVAVDGHAIAQVLFFDDFDGFGNGTDLTSMTYTPGAGPSQASVVTSVQNGSPTIRATNFLGSIWALFDNAAPTNKNQYKGLLASVQTNQSLRVSWRMWIQATNAGTGGLLLSVPVQDSNPNVSFNPPLAFMDSGVIMALTNGTSVLTPIGNWESMAGQITTNTLVLNYPQHTFSLAFNGQASITLPLGPYFTNVVGAIYFNGVERSPGSLGNRFAVDDVKVERLPASGSAPPFVWAKRVANTFNTDGELAIGLAIDTAANVYVTGWFDGANDFGNSVVLTSIPDGGQDMFVAKYDSSGSLLWARQGGGDSGDWDGGRGVGVDNAGNVYVTGQFVGTALFDGVTATAPDNKEFFLAKYNQSGVIQWIRQSVGGNGTLGAGWSDGVYGTGLAVDGAGNSYAIGFAANVTSDGTPITFQTTPLLNAGVDGASAFLVKYDPTGDVAWVKSFNSPDESYSTAVTVDGNGNTYVAGSFRTAITIDAIQFTSVGTQDGFVAKLNNAGTVQWASHIKGGPRVGDSSIALDRSGHVYVGGGFGTKKGDTVTFGPSLTLTNIGGGLGAAAVGDAFLAKFDGATGAPLSAVRAGGTNADYYLAGSTDADGNVYVGGGTAGSDVLGGFQAIITKFDPAGTLQWTQASGGTNGTSGAVVFAGPLVDASGNCYVAGWLQNSAVFGATTLTGHGYWDFFIAKIGAGSFGSLRLGIAWEDALPQLSVFGDMGNRFALEYVPALAAGGAWQPLLTNTLTASPFLHTDVNARGSATRLYRARMLP